MEITIKSIQDIADTLPIGYYIGREVKVEIDSDSSTAYYDIMGDKIYLSYNLIKQAAEKVDSLNENDVRTILYHELSHAILTPKSMTKAFSWYYTHTDRFQEVVNIFEDQRIETLLKGYYRGVDFEEMVKRINGDAPYSEDPLIKFFRVVRLGDDSDLYKNDIDSIIQTFESMNRNSVEYVSYDYLSKIDELYNKIIKDLQDGKTDPNTDTSDNRQSGSDKSEGSSSKSQQGQSSSDSDENDSSSAGDSKSASSLVEDAFADGQDESAHEAGVRGSSTSQKISKVTDYYFDRRLYEDLERIFTGRRKKSKMNSSAVHSYSGMFDPRSAGRSDYKFFLQKGNGSARGYSKVHLNLFLDRSGSFSNNVFKANQILYALSRIERRYRDFDFTLITCGDGETIEDNKNREHDAWDGTKISDKIYETFRRVQVKGADNINLVLYDGIAMNSHNFAAFNTSNTILVVDGDCEKAVKKYCPSALKVIVNDGKYAEHLFENIISSLERVS